MAQGKHYYHKIEKEENRKEVLYQSKTKTHQGKH